MRDALGRLVRLFNQLFQFARGQVQPLVVVGVNDRQLFANLRVERMLLQMFHIIGGELRRVNFGGSQMPGSFQQADIFHTFRHGQRLAVVGLQ